MIDAKPSQPLGLVSSAQLGQVPKRASTCGLTECRDKPMCVRCERIEDQAAMSALLPEGVDWGDHLTPAIARELLTAERERWERALRQTWQAIDPFRPAGQPGSYARGYDNGFAAALQVLRGNLKA